MRKGIWVVVTVELVVVCLGVAAGVVFALEAWPAPWFPLAWSAALFVGFSAYRVVDFALGRRRAGTQVDAGEQVSGDGPGAALAGFDAAVMAARANYHNRIMEGQAGDGENAQIALGSGSEDPTQFLVQPELRPETAEDLSNPQELALPLFAESTLAPDQRRQTLQTMMKVQVGPLANSEARTLAAGDGVAAIDGPASKDVDAGEDVALDKTSVLPPVQSSSDEAREGKGVPQTLKMKARGEKSAQTADATALDKTAYLPEFRPDKAPELDKTLVEPVVVGDDPARRATDVMPSLKTGAAKGNGSKTDISRTKNPARASKTADSKPETSGQKTTKLQGNKPSATRAQKPRDPLRTAGFMQPLKVSGQSSASQKPTGQKPASQKSASQKPAGAQMLDDTAQVVNIDMVEAIRQKTLKAGSRTTRPGDKKGDA